MDLIFKSRIFARPDASRIAIHPRPEPEFVCERVVDDYFDGLAGRWRFAEDCRIL